MTKEITKNKSGRPTKRSLINAKISKSMTKLDDEMIIELKKLFELDARPRDICYHCNITEQTLYNWKKKNPKLFEALERFRAKPVLTARQEIVKGIQNDKYFAMKYLEKKLPNEFGNIIDVNAKLDFSFNIKVIDKDGRYNINEKTKDSV